MIKSSKLLKLILLAIAVLFYNLSFATAVIPQDEEIIEEEEVEDSEEEVLREIINLTTLNELMQADENEIIISDYDIISSESDSKLLIDKVFFSLYEITHLIDKAKKVYFYNCKFNLADNAPLVFKDWDFSKLNIVGCELLSPIEFAYSTHSGQYPFLIENCIIQDNLKFTGSLMPIKSIRFKNNEISTAIIIDIPVGSLYVSNCRFIADKIKYDSRDSEKNHYQFSADGLKIGEVFFEENKFNNSKLKNVFSLNFEGSEIGELTMYKNSMQIMNLSYAEIQKSLLIDSLFVENYIGILNFDFPESNTNVPWYNLGNEKLAIFYYDESELIIPYQAKSDEELSDNLKYNDLISAYSKLNTLYHDRGDISSANSSYVEIKDIETRKQAFTQKINPSFNNLINYKLNIFLRFFSDYATNPGKSLIQSIWVILIFTLLYMVSFSRWDGMNYKYYLHQFNRFSIYITTKTRIEDVFTNDMALENNDIQELRKKYQREGKEMPRILKLFGEPLHFLGKFRYEVIPGLIRVLNFQPGAWKDIKTKPIKKMWSGTVIILISSMFLVYVLVVKFLNSLLLSLNSFVVIGYGALPEEDEWFAMYLSIIEGIIGWFLLTIFTITLLSQVLQSA